MDFELGPKDEIENIQEAENNLSGIYSDDIDIQNEIEYLRQNFKQENNVSELDSEGQKPFDDSK